jgi:hypothetical protein
MHKYTEVEIRKMLEFFIDNILRDQVFQKSAGSHIGMNYAPLIMGLFLYTYATEFIQRLPHEKKKSFAVQLHVINFEEKFEHF